MGQGKTLEKACVSIILDNTDKSKSPPGQQKYDEIVVSRTVQKGGDCRVSCLKLVGVAAAEGLSCVVCKYYYFLSFFSVPH